MSAADVLAVATPSWKMKGLLSANDLVDSSTATFDVVVDDDVFAVAIVSDFVAASLVVALLVLRRMAIT